MFKIKTPKLKSYLLEDRLFIYTLSFMILISIISIIGNLLIGFDFSMNNKWIVSIVVSLLSLKLTLDRKFLMPVRLFTYFSILFFFPLGYISSGGSNLFVAYLFLLCININYVFHGKIRGLFNVIILIISLGLVTLKFQYPSIFPVYQSSQNYIDMMVQLPIALILSMITLRTFSNAFRGERKKLTEYGALLHKKNKELEKISQTDHLTGLFNRRYIFNMLEQISKENVKTIIVLIDIDNFKQVNDRFGHEAGDQILLKFSQILNTEIGDKGIVGRLGGDEFIILLRNIELAEGKALANSLLKEVNKLELYEGVNLCASGGISVYDGKTDIKQMVAHADQSMYKVKATGKNAMLFVNDKEHEASII